MAPTKSCWWWKKEPTTRNQQHHGKEQGVHWEHSYFEGIRHCFWRLGQSQAGHHQEAGFTCEDSRKALPKLHCYDGENLGWDWTLACWYTWSDDSKHADTHHITGDTRL